MNRIRKLLVVGTIVFLFFALAWNTVYGRSGTDILLSGERLMAGEYLTLPNGERQLIMQSDGNLVLYGRKIERLLWQSGTSDHPGAYYKMEDDGNLVVYSADDEKLWESETAGNPGSELVMGDDGNLVIYSPPRKFPLWESGTSGNPGAYYKMQDDGNLVVYNADGKALWASGTEGNPGAELYIGDGNLIIFSPPITSTAWSSGTAGNPGAKLVMQDNGNLVIYSAEGKELWDTNTSYYKGSKYRMQDGELQVYSPEHCDFGLPRRCWSEKIHWKSGTAGIPDPNLVMQADGNLVITSTAPQILWETGTGGNPDAELVMEEDGNLVLYTAPEKQLLWESGTTGDDHKGAKLVMEDDGNLVIKMPPVRKASWETGTDGHPGAYAALSDEGQLQVRRGDNGEILWNSGSKQQAGFLLIDEYLKLRSDGNLVLVWDGNYYFDEVVWETGTTLAWMEKLGSNIADFSIRDLAIPGTHDSGTYGLNNSKFADDGNFDEWIFDVDGYWPTNIEIDIHWVKHYTSWWPHIPYWTLHISFIPHARQIEYFAKTQGRSVYQQLHNGIRYFDMRVLYDDDHLYLIHTLKGPNVFGVINDVNHYLREHPYEIVILDFNHFYTQDGSGSSIPDKWNRKLYKKIISSMGDLMIPPPDDVNDLTVYDIWASGKQVIVFYNQDAPDDIDASNFWPGSKQRNEWLNQQNWFSGGGKDGLESAMNDEAECVVKRKPDCKDAGKKLWVMQGILTFDRDEFLQYVEDRRLDLLIVWLGGNRGAAYSVNDHVRYWALNKSYTKDINILLGDWAADADLVETAIQVNLKKAGMDYLNPGIAGLPLDLSEPEPPPATPLEETVGTIPVVVPPPDIRLEATGVATDVDLGEGVAYDWVDGWLPATHDAAKGSFPIGIHKVTWSSADPSGVTGRARQTVRIVSHAPVADKTVLRPPNHEMSMVTIQANVVPSLQGLVTLSASVASNEPVEGLGNDDRAPDWGEPEIDQEKGIIRVPLRAECSAQGVGRVYTVTVVATDSSGNQSEAIVQVEVPKQQFWLPLVTR